MLNIFHIPVGHFHNFYPGFLIIFKLNYLFSCCKLCFSYILDIDTGGSHFGELIQPHGHWCWQALVWSPPSSLLVLGVYLSTSWSVPVLRPQRPIGELPGDPAPLPKSWHLPQVPLSQLLQEMSPPTSRPTPFPGPPNHTAGHASTWPHPPAAATAGRAWKPTGLATSPI